MVNKRYRKGYRFEIRVKKFLEKRGYKVFRAAGSKPLDLIAVSSDKIYFIECKATMKGVKSKNVGNKIIEISRDTCAEPIIAYKDDRNSIHFYNPLEKKEVDIPYSKSLDMFM